MARSARHIVSSLTMEELRTYFEIPDDIDLKLMEKPNKSTLGGEHNAVFFTESKDFVFKCPPLLNSFFTLPRRHRPLFIPT